MKHPSVYDCIVIGGGIAGLTAGIYLARFKCHFKILDNDDSRASLIPISHNFPGFPEGIPGKEIIKRLRKQLDKYAKPSTLLFDNVISLEYDDHHKVFQVDTKKKSFYSRYVILATGVKDYEPSLPQVESAVKKGLIRHCLICDGYEVKNQTIGILGDSKKALKQAFLLAKYSKNITVINLGKRLALTSNEKKKLLNSNIKIFNERIVEVEITKNRISLIKTNHDEYTFDTIYSGLGCQIHSDLATLLGAKHAKDHSLIVNDHQQTSIPGLYAAGDVVSGLNQMCVAASEGAIVATHVFNLLNQL